MKAHSYAIQLCFVFALLLIGSAYAVFSVNPAISPAANISAINPQITVANNTNSTGGLLMPSASAFTLNPAVIEALKEGPMVYAATTKSIIVMDSSKFNVISSIKPDMDKAMVNGVAVSPDGQFVYMAYSWSVYQDDPYGGHYDDFARVMRINSSSQQPIDYYELDGIYPEHLAVSPDGKVYLGYQGSYYPENGGIRIMDFQGQKVWNIDMKYTTMMYDIEFSPDGNKIFYSGWWGAPAVYQLDWNSNTVHYNLFPGDSTSDDFYARSVAVGKGGDMLYVALADTTGIFAMNTNDYGKQEIQTDYYPIALAASPDGETLYAIGYFYNQDNKPVYLIHKYGALKTVGPFNNELMDYMLTTMDNFYTYDSLTYVDPPSGTRPSNIAITPDGRFAYISTISYDSITNVYGDGIIIYDLQYMNQVKIIDEKNSLHDIAASSSKILFSPPPDYSWIKGFSGGISVGNLPGLSVLYPTSFHPENGTFAKYYQEDFFSVYATFSDVLDNKTVNGSTFWLTDKNGNNVPGKVTAASKLAILMPDSQLSPNTDYVAHISKEIKSKDGKQLYADAQWSFTTRNITNAVILPINTILNLTYAEEIKPLVHLNISIPPGLLNNSSGGGQNATPKTPPPQAQQQPQNQSGNQSQGQTQGQQQGEGGQPPAPPAPGQENVSQQAGNGGQNGNVSQPPENVSNQSQGAPPGNNVTQPPANISYQGTTQPSTQPQAQGGNDIIGAIIDFFKSLFGMK